MSFVVDDLSWLGRNALANGLCFIFICVICEQEIVFVNN